MNGGDNDRFLAALDDAVEASQSETLDEMTEGPHHVNDVLEKDFERQQAAGDNPLPPAPVSETRLASPVLNQLTTKKVHHDQMVFEGVCESCAHCGMPLTDSVSVERGIGPICSKKGYLEDPANGDEIQAMIDLAEYPELVDFLTANYKPLGLRGLMNGLVKVCSLNRKHEVFGACCDAIQSLGYVKLAALLRESIATVSVKKLEKHTGFFSVWVQKCDYDKEWGREMLAIPGAKQVKQARGILIPINDVNRKAIWRSLREYYEGLVVRTEKGAFKIGARPKAKNS